MTLPKPQLKTFCWLFLFAAIAVAPMVFRGIPGGNDAVQHYEFAQQVVDAFHSGGWFPHFAGNSNHGFGDVGLRVYPPLSYYVLAACYFAFGDWYLASLFVFFVIFLMGGIGVYLWSREYFDVGASIAAAGIFTFAPFHLNEIYNNFLYAEFASSAVLPFCFLFATRVMRGRDLSAVFFLGTSFALLIVTHLPMTVIGSVALGIYTIAILGFKSLAPYLRSGIAVALGLVLSSFYWVRMITEMDLVKHSQPQFFANIWSYDQNFLLSARTFTDFMNDGQSLWFGDIILVATVAICIPSFFALRKSDCWGAFCLPVIILFATSIVFTTPLSSLVWNNIPLLQKVQFPWRWLSIITMAGSVIAGAGSVMICRSSRRASVDPATFALAVSILPFVFLSAFVVRAAYFNSTSEFSDRAATLSDGETFEGWWPVGAKREAFSRKEKVGASGRRSTIDEWLPTKRSFSIEEGEAAVVSISTFYYPHWNAFIDGAPAATGISNDGLIQLEIPKERVKVEIDFTEPTIVTASNLVSIFAWLSLFGALIICYVRRVRSYGTYS